MNVTKHKESAGHYEIRRDGQKVARALGLSDGNWALMVEDGTDMTFNGRLFRNHASLKDAVKFYTYCRKHNHA